MARYLLAGDTHGDYQHFDDLCHWAHRYFCDTIIQVGDFGYIWKEGRRTYAEAIAVLDDLLARYDLKLLWLDGNHENFDALREQFGAHPDAPAEVAMSDRVTYLPRGYRFELDGLKCMSFGGAVSIDKERRSNHISWWAEELITDEQVARVTEGPVDILFSHDCPAGGPALDVFLAQGWSIPYKLDKLSKASRTRMREVYNKIQPKVIVHGHYHHRYNDKINDTTVIGLSMNGSGSDSFTVLDTDDWERP